MIDFYGWNTSNGRKVAILLEELELSYNYVPVDIHDGEQHRGTFLALNPNGKIPVIVDNEGPGGDSVTLFESGAIMMYLAEKARSPLLPSDTVMRFKVVQWLMFQMGGIGPMFGQALYFYKYSRDRNIAATKRYMDELHRLFGVMERHLFRQAYFAGQYSIADIAIYPWVLRHPWYDLEWRHYPSVKRWFDALSERGAVQRGLQVLSRAG